MLSEEEIVRLQSILGVVTHDFEKKELFAHNYKIETLLWLATKVKELHLENKYLSNIRGHRQVTLKTKLGTHLVAVWNGTGYVCIFKCDTLSLTIKNAKEHGASHLKEDIIDE